MFFMFNKENGRFEILKKKKKHLIMLSWENGKVQDLT